MVDVVVAMLEVGAQAVRMLLEKLPLHQSGKIKTKRSLDGIRKVLV